MSNLALLRDPIEIILSATQFEKPDLRNSFKNALLELWGFESFKAILDLTATKCMRQELIFKVSNKRFFEMDEGNCKTISTPVNSFLNRFKAQKKFVISIKIIDTAVIIHEIAHMIEQDSELSITEGFTQILLGEAARAVQDKTMVGPAVNGVMVRELKGYQKSHIPSELFARIYQLLAMSQEIYGYAKGYAFSYASVVAAFAATLKWLRMNIDPIVRGRADAGIVSASVAYLHKEEGATSSWSAKRVESFHKKSAGSDAGKWSKAIPSMHDTEF